MTKILLGVGGSIAAYKALFLVRTLQKQGYDVQAILTDGAQKFVTPLSFEALTHHPVAQSLWETNEQGWARHLQAAQEAHAILIAPATADLIARLAMGRADDLLTATVLSARCPILVAPAMEGNMYRHPALQKNLHQLRKWGYTVIPPGRGYLASGKEDEGRLASLSRILLALQRALHPPLLAGKKVLITLGATREYLDPVRYLSNGSTGKMGKALAEAFYAYGATVHLVAGHTEVPLTPFKKTFTPTAQKMFETVQQIYTDYDILVFAAAVSDFTTTPAVQKIKKSDPPSLQLSLTPDILAYVAQNKLSHQKIIGFALETQDLLTQAHQKRIQKGVDWLVANRLSPKEGIGSDTNQVWLLSADQSLHFPLQPKKKLAYALVDLWARTS
ncbi:MAG: bifunctional phosphopantothenoylcysteine decarboxylase/phosphopantothenate--cysteine ligase CoaBC [Bacteroidia bacterium]